ALVLWAHGCRPPGEQLGGIDAQRAGELPDGAPADPRPLAQPLQGGRGDPRQHRQTDRVAWEPGTGAGHLRRRAADERGARLLGPPAHGTRRPPARAGREPPSPTLPAPRGSRAVRPGSEGSPPALLEEPPAASQLLLCSC